MKVKSLSPLPLKQGQKPHDALRYLRDVLVEIVAKEVDARSMEMYYHWHCGASIASIAEKYQLTVTTTKRRIDDVDRWLFRCFHPRKLSVVTKFAEMAIKSYEAEELLDYLIHIRTSPTPAAGDEILLADMPVRSLNLSVHAQNVLYWAAPYATIGELCELKAQDILKVKGCGKKAIEEIKQALAKGGFALAQ